MRSLMLAIFVVSIWSGSSRAHDIYSGLTDSWGKACCDETDCRPARFRTTAEGLEMLVDDDWIAVHQQAIQYRALTGDTGTTGGGHWCGSKLTGLGTTNGTHITRCAIVPPNLVLGPERGSRSLR